ncbi:hypothetical protein TKK_0017062 [Trichogramma kaykai]|uniref:Translation initiation factor eIF2B subunit epsilon n=1 Tax=Trichogramma kaykai TaxID=54128 RepID=A0ABD2W4F4_9HYME
MGTKSKGYEGQECLQALLIADNFNDNLSYANNIYPDALMPVVNTPMLEYALQTLCTSGVQEVFLYFSRQIDYVKSCLKPLKKQFGDWIKITPIFSDGCRTFGDAMRHIDTIGCIRNDFILLRGSAFTNADLKDLMNVHKAKKREDKNAAMTMVLKDFGNLKDTTLRHERHILYSNNNTKQVLQIIKHPPGNNNFHMPLQFFLSNQSVTIKSDAVDTHVYLCSQSVLSLFSDNFDFQTIEDFIRIILINEELYNTRIYWQPLLPTDFALPIQSWRAYRLLTKFILRRHGHPLAPDSRPKSLREYVFTNVLDMSYKHHSALLSNGASIGKDSIIGESSELGENSAVNTSVIGANCVIGKKVSLVNTLVFSGAKVGDSCVIKNSIIFENCTISAQTKLTNCIIMPNVMLNKIENYENTVLEIALNNQLSEKKLEDLEIYKILSTEISYAEKYDDFEDPHNDHCHSDTSSTRASTPTAILEDDDENFLSEVIESLHRGYQDKLECGPLIIEINCSRFAYDIPLNHVSYNVMKAILILPFLQNEKHLPCANIYRFYKMKKEEIMSITATEYFKSLKKILTYFKPILVNYIKPEIGQEDCLQAIEDFVYSNKKYIMPYLKNLLHLLYNDDVLSEQVILDWYEQEYKSDSPNAENTSDITESLEKIAIQLRKEITPFITWLQEAEEDSSDEDSS